MPERLERLMRIYNRLRRSPMSIEILTKWTKQASIDVSERQLYRDMNALTRLQFAKGENVIEYNGSKNIKTWKLEYDENSETLTPYDINSFFLFKNFVPSCLSKERKDSFEKFETILYKYLSKSNYQSLIQANELYLKRHIHKDAIYGIEEQKLIEYVIEALQNKKQIVIHKITVNPSNEKFDKLIFPITINPMELLFHEGRLYIAGLEDKTKQLLLFVIDKNLIFTISKRVFNRKKILDNYVKQLSHRFGISSAIDNKVYNIKIEFARGYAESMMNFSWHNSKRWQELPNGNYLLHLHCSIGREMIGWLVLGLDKVKIHQPKILKHLVIQKLQQTLAVYQNNLPIDEVTANKDY
jgi:predicted DNA-binding transcriptional regulator YafY